jgi:hypothetical protein
LSAESGWCVEEKDGAAIGKPVDEDIDLVPRVVIRVVDKLDSKPRPRNCVCQLRVRVIAGIPV